MNNNNQSKNELIKINKELTQHLYELHNIFKVSLEITSILDLGKLNYTYLINVVGILRSSGAILLLPDLDNPHYLTVANFRGYSKNIVENIKIPFSEILQNYMQVIEGSHKILKIEHDNSKTILQEAYQTIKNLGIKLIAPISHINKFVGLVLVGESVTNDGFREADFDLFSLLNNFYATVYSHATLVADLEAQSTTDHLTTLLNRRAFNDALTREISRGLRHNDEFSLVLLDIDHFKQYNDHNGHLAGDELLKQFAQVLKQGARTSDIISRYGGEEFAIILIGVDENGSLCFCNRLIDEIQNYPFKNGANQPMGFVSASFGSASFPINARSNHELIACSDEALYRAKNTGRNRVVSYNHLLRKDNS